MIPPIHLINEFFIGNTMSVFLIDIFFFSITFWDVLDVLIVSLILFQVYRILRGTVAFNIFVGIVSLFILWWLVGFLKMDLLNMILSQFVSLGVIMIVIVFQPEIRRFLLLLGDRTLKAGPLEKISSLFKRKGEPQKIINERAINELLRAVKKMSEDKTGALIVFCNVADVPKVYDSGIHMNAEISTSLITTIFQKNTPLHDGALLIEGDKLMAAGCILPLSESKSLPAKYGLRHRAALGIGEIANVKSIIVSEETGRISSSHKGAMYFNLTDNELSEFLYKTYTEII